MKASSYLKIGVSCWEKGLTQKNIQLLYIYNIIKRNTQGLVSFAIHFCFFVWSTYKKHRNEAQVRSRGKAGMKTSSFLKIGVNKKCKTRHSKIHVFTIYNIIKRNTQGLVSFFINLFFLWKHKKNKLIKKLERTL